MRKKSERTGKLHTSIRRAKVCWCECAYTPPKNDFFIFARAPRCLYLRTALSGLCTVWIVFDDFITFVAILYYIWGHHCICGQFLLHLRALLHLWLQQYSAFLKIYENFARNDELVCATKWRGVNFINTE